jgi:hypothetical protein
MATTERLMKATPRQVAAVLSDGWNYGDWVVGAVHIRAVDPAWPKPGAKVHHRLGGWPLMLSDETESTAYDPDSRLEMRARLRPFGEAEVRLRWEPVSTEITRVRMDEQFVGGPMVSMRNRLADAFLHARNSESLARLENLTQKYAS